MDWTKADLLKPESYKPFLNGANAVVHSMGILLEADYKGVVQGREPIISGLQRAFSSSKLGSQNPLQRHEGEPLEPKEGDKQLTYELMNRDSGSYMTMFFSFMLSSSCANSKNSHCVSSGIIKRTCPDIRIHLRCRWSTNSSKQIYHDQKRCRSNHIIEALRSAEYFYAATIHVRLKQKVHTADSVGWIPWIRVQ